MKKHEARKNYIAKLIPRSPAKTTLFWNQRYNHWCNLITVSKGGATLQLSWNSKTNPCTTVLLPCLLMLQRVGRSYKVHQTSEKFCNNEEVKWKLLWNTLSKIYTYFHKIPHSTHRQALRAITGMPGMRWRIWKEKRSLVDAIKKLDDNTLAKETFNSQLDLGL